MKIRILFVGLAGTLFVQAQGLQHRTVEERVKRATDTPSTLLKFEKAYQDQTGAIFTDYYKAMDKLREGLPDGERPGSD